MPELLRRPKFDEFPPKLRPYLGNGVGNELLPDWAIGFLTQTANWFFDEASWRHHDFGYTIGGDKWDRKRCDWKFFKAMRKDAWRQNLILWPIAAPAAYLIAVVFYLAVRIGGWRSFAFQAGYTTQEELIERAETARRRAQGSTAS